MIREINQSQKDKRSMSPPCVVNSQRQKENGGCQGLGGRGWGVVS